MLPAQINEDTLKNRETANPIKERVYHRLCQLITQENGLNYKAPVEKAFAPYKTFIGKGNNSFCVRQLLKQRWWWQFNDKEREDMNGVNFLWTQWRKNDVIASLTADKDVEAPEEPDKNDPLATINPAGRQQNTTKIYNKMEDNFHLSNKKALFLNMRQYYEIQGLDVFQVLPVTFHIKNGDQDPEFVKFSEYYQAEEEKRTGKINTANVWIIKPGENTNRG